MLSNETYDEYKVSQWVDSICEGCMKGLIELNKPFKYVGKSLMPSGVQTVHAAC